MKLGDPADKALEDGHFQKAPVTSRRAGSGGLEFYIERYTQHPAYSAPGGVAGILAQEIHRLRALLRSVV